MISVYYNQKYGFLIVPNAIERFMGCYISIEPTIEIMACLLYTSDAADD